MRYWIGGSPCAGKSTIANLLGERFGWSVYHVDEHTSAHWKRSTAEEQPTFHRLMQLTGDALWMRPVKQQVREAIQFSADPFLFILEDCSQMPAHETLIVEGTALLPHLVAPLLDTNNRSIWLIPTEAFQRDYYARREWVSDVLAACSNPAQAWENWMQRDAQFGHWIQSEVSRLGLTSLVIDTEISIENVAEHVLTHFESAVV